MRGEEILLLLKSKMFKKPGELAELGYMDLAASELAPDKHFEKTVPSILKVQMRNHQAQEVLRTL